MNTRAPEPARLRFGVFELELQTGELRRSGTLLHLPPQPFKVLALLASRAGQLVTREELRNKIWGPETFVDFEHGLNVAIKEIRVTLGDNASAPAFIETLPKRGYRFLVPVHSEDSLADSTGTPPQDDSDRKSGQPTAPASENLQPSRKSARRWQIALAALTIALLLILAGVLSNVGNVRSRVQAALSKLPHTVPGRIESIAVLPMENLSGDPEQEYFSDGLTDTLITDLGRIGTMNVISRASVMRYKRGKTPMPQIARELKVDAVVEGTVLRSGNRIRISIQLLDARSDRHLWADTYERDFVDVIPLEHLLALAVAHEISGRLTPAQEMKLEAGRPTNMRAYDAYLQGRHLLGERTEEAELAARAYFTDALQADPDFALAYSGLADTYSVGWFAKLDLPKAEEYARKAIQLAPELAEGHASLGVAQTYGLKLDQAGEELKRAVALNPNYAMAHHWLSMRQLFIGNQSEALAENARARLLDPYSLPINFMRGLILFHSHDFDGAIQQFQYASSLSPLSPGPHRQLWRIYWLKNQIPQALAEQKMVSDLTHDARMSRDTQTIALVLQREGPHAALEKQAELADGYLKEISGRSDPSSTYSPEDAACFYGLLGKRKQTLERLRRAFEVDGPNSPLALTAPEFDFLRSDSEYQTLLRRAGLQQ